MFEVYDRIAEKPEDKDFELFLYEISRALPRLLDKEQLGYKTAVNSRKSNHAHKTDIVYNDNQTDGVENYEDNKVD